MLHNDIISIYMLWVYFPRTTLVPQIPMCVKLKKNECIQKMGYVPKALTDAQSALCNHALVIPSAFNLTGGDSRAAQGCGLTRP